MTPTEHSSSDRPWITNPDHDFDQMSLSDIYLNPFGTTPITHFRRAWLFLVLIALFTIFITSGLPGAAKEGGDIVGQAAFIIVLILFTTIATFSLHARRAADAGRSRLWALIVLVPFLTASPMAFLGGQQGVQKHKVELAIYEFRKDPEALKATAPDRARLAEQTLEERRKQAEERRKKAEEREKKRREEAEAKGEEYEPPKRQRRRGRPGGRPGQGEPKAPAIGFFVAKGAIDGATAPWAITSLIAMLFSLIGFARWPSVDDDDGLF